MTESVVTRSRHIRILTPGILASISPSLLFPRQESSQDKNPLKTKILSRQESCFQDTNLHFGVVDDLPSGQFNEKMPMLTVETPKMTPEMFESLKGHILKQREKRKQGE